MESDAQPALPMAKKAGSFLDEHAVTVEQPAESASMIDNVPPSMQLRTDEEQTGAIWRPWLLIHF